MTHVDFLLRRVEQAAEAPAIAWKDAILPYRWLATEVADMRARLAEWGVPRGAVVSLEADFSPRATALLLALMDHGCVIAPLTRSVEDTKLECRAIAEVEYRIAIDASDDVGVTASGVRAQHALVRWLREAGHPGLVLFSSGSTGKRKAALHDLVPMLKKFTVPRHTLRTITFLLFDHVGGFNTLLYNLSNAGCVITVSDRRPETICQAIERHRVELLPTSPTFLNLLLVSEAHRHFDLSSLRLVTYGTEVMPQSTLDRLHATFPHVTLAQTYGLSEVGILRSKSKSSDSLWVKIGGEGFETRVVGGKLEIRAESAMLGYLNRPSPFTPDGWFMTGDAVEVDGEYIRILGPTSALINVGGQKVYPADVESVLQFMDGVREVVVGGEPHPMTGQIVHARVRLSTSETLAEFRARMRLFCQDRLPRFAIPHKVELVTESLHGERFKKQRRP